MKVIDKELVIIGSNEYCEKDGRYFFRSGLEPQMDHLAQYFKKTYHYSPKSEFNFDGYEFKNVEIKPFSNIHHRNHKELWNRKEEYFESIKKIYKEHKNAIFMVYIPDAYIGLIAAYYLKKVKAPWFARVTSDQLQEMRVRGNSVKRKIAYFILRPFHIGFMRWLLKDIFQVYTGKQIFYNNKYSYSVNSSNLFLEDIKVKNRNFNCPVNILYVGRFDTFKGVNILIDSLQYIKHDNYCLNIIGFDNKENTDDLLKRISRSTKRENINFIGQVNYGKDLFKYYDDADILVFPSLYETQGKTYLEAMARGTCVIATKVGGIPGIIKHKENGLLIKPNSVIEIAHSIDNLILDVGLQNKLKENGYKTAKNSTIDMINDTIIKGLKKFNIGDINDTNS